MRLIFEDNARNFYEPRPPLNYLVSKAVFDQSFSAEKLTNGALTSWSGGHLVGWTTTGESSPNIEFVQRAPLETHAASPGGTGAANIFSNSNTQPRIAQTVLTNDKLYEVSFIMTARVSGNIAFGGFVGLGSNNFITVSKVRVIGRSNATTFTIQAGTQPTDLTFNTVTVKELTPGVALVTPVKATHTFMFGVPSDPGGAEEVALWYRMPSIGDEYKNGFSFYLRRRTGNTNWDGRVDRFASSARTNLVNFANAGANTAGLRVSVDGNTHTLETYDAVTGLWTPRTSFTDSNYATATLANIVYPSDITPLDFKVAA